MLLLFLAACGTVTKIDPHLTPLDFEPAQGWKKSIEGPKTLRYTQVKPSLKRAQEVLHSGIYKQRHQHRHPLSPIDSSFMYRLRRLLTERVRFYWLSPTKPLSKADWASTKKLLNCEPMSNREIAFRQYQGQERPFRNEAVEQLFFVLADEMLQRGHRPSYPQIYSPRLAAEVGQLGEEGLLGMNLKNHRVRRAGFWVCP